ncbi:MAG TPA: substrate-binding domain-containing protein [Terriglobia bacterium]|nr:substrate-binding domain-containing protein [Terriglobia bacterium]
MKVGIAKIVKVGLLLMVALLSSCQKPLHDENELYILVAANISLPYWHEAQAGFAAAAHGLGVKADFAGPESYSPDDELSAFQKAVARHPSGILISPAQPDKFKDAIDAAIKDGIPVICVDSDSPASGRILFVGTDNYQAGLESGKRMAQLLHGKGNVVLITIPGQLNLDERARGVTESFQKFPQIKIFKTFDDKGDPRSANDQISALLESKNPKDKPDGIVCVEASGGPGAAEALHRINLDGKIPIVAMDDNPETLDWIKRGVISATIGQKPYTMSFYGLKLLDDLHHNAVHEFKDWQTSPVSPLPARVDTGTTVIDASNLAAYQAAMVAHPTEP